MLGVVSQPASPEAFPGLYATSLPERPFVDGGGAVLLNSQWGNRGVIIRVDLGSGGVLHLSDVEDALGTWTLLDTNGGVPSFRQSLSICLASSLYLCRQTGVLLLLLRLQSLPIMLESSTLCPHKTGVAELPRHAGFAIWQASAYPPALY